MHPTSEKVIQGRDFTCMAESVKDGDLGRPSCACVVSVFLVSL
jgi:hypothetical protein